MELQVYIFRRLFSASIALAEKMHLRHEELADKLAG